MERRKFIKNTATTAALAGLATLLPSTSDASERVMGAGEDLKLGVIGLNNMGFKNLAKFLANEGVECIAICDIDQAVLDKRSAEIASLQGGKKPKQFGDYRNLLEHKDIDAVIIATPDHWHCLQFVDALEAGKHVYLEKPIGNSIEEINIMESAAVDSDRVVQVGQWQRSDPHWQKAIDFVRSGKLGEIRTVKGWAYMPWDGYFPVVPDQLVPEGVDYNMWLGPAPFRSFSPYRFHWNWRWFWDYAGGLMTDWGVHILDFALYGMDRYVPLSIMSSGGKFAFPDDAKETPDTQYAIYEFQDFGLVWESAIGIGGGLYGRTHGVAFLGQNGTLVVNRRGWEVIPEVKRGASMMEAASYTSVDSPGGLDLHVKNFIGCIKSGERPNAPIEIGADIARFAQLGNIAYRTGRKVFWDHEDRCFVNDDAANALMKPSYRDPWELPSFQ